MKLAMAETLDQHNPEKRPKTFEEHLMFVRELHEKLLTQKIDPNDKRTGRELLDGLYDEHGLPK